MKLYVAYALQVAGSVTAVVTAFCAHPLAGGVSLAVIACVHGAILEREHTAQPAAREKRGDA